MKRKNMDINSFYIIVFLFSNNNNLGVPLRVGLSLQVLATLHFAVGFPFNPSRGLQSQKFVLRNQLLVFGSWELAFWGLVVSF